MIRYIRDIQARRKGVELEPGFTLIELLIVIVVLGILAATVIFALTGVTGQSAVAACNSDAKTYEVAVAAYQNSPENTSNAAAGNTNALITPPFASAAFLHAAANNTAYAIAITGDTGAASGVNNWSGTPALPAGAAGTVYVLDKEDATPAWVAYDAQGASGGCNSTNL